jgi:hypothetical protein
MNLKGKIEMLVLESVDDKTTIYKVRAIVEMIYHVIGNAECEQQVIAATEDLLLRYKEEKSKQ